MEIKRDPVRRLVDCDLSIYMAYEIAVSSRNLTYLYIPSRARELQAIATECLEEETNC